MTVVMERASLRGDDAQAEELMCDSAGDRAMLLPLLDNKVARYSSARRGISPLAKVISLSHHLSGFRANPAS
jgi:hypothetical protein